MKFIKTIKREQSAAVNQQKDAYLWLVDDLETWPGTNSYGVAMATMPVFKPKALCFRLYITSRSQEYSYDTVGEADEQSFKIKFSGTHPGSSQSALEFAKVMLGERFIVMIPDCEGSKTIVLGIPSNPLVFTSSHKSGSDGRRFTFQFEQLIGSDEVYMLGDFHPLSQNDLQINFNADFNNDYNNDYAI